MVAVVSITEMEKKETDKMYVFWDLLMRGFF